MSVDNVEIIEKTICYKGFFSIARLRLRHRKYDGEWSDILTREIFERGHAVAVLPYDPVRDEVVLIEQFRVGALDFPADPWLVEIVAGIIDEGESAEGVAHREMAEEAGCKIEQLEHVCDYLVSPGGTTESTALFCGKVDTIGVGGVHGLIDEGEDIKVSVVSYDEAVLLLNSGRINSASPIIALQWLILNRKRLQREWCK
ncbi:ADP-ribose pyrophosphatase [hydrothermal vent metagenome]|uniref:ADP-ribose pyrophosphatase n=1 Tax=hydrothermal vent metagenome TaxID=652676 RepID=A0A3B0Z7H1_9ZZZZ